MDTSRRCSKQVNGVKDDLGHLALLIQQRNTLDDQIARLIGRPAQLGHIGEYIASKVFNITLTPIATTKGIDGHFADGPLTGRTVNIKFYPKMEGLLDMRLDGVPDFYLVLTGPRVLAMSSKGQPRPVSIQAVFLLEGSAVVEDLTHRGRKVGVASSVRSARWEAAEIFPRQANTRLILSTEQRIMLELFQ